MNTLESHKKTDSPKLWHISRDIDKAPTLDDDGNILNHNFRVVVISEVSTDSPLMVAQAVKDDVLAFDVIGHFMKSGFDLHHTPDTSYEISSKKVDDKNHLASAKLLADTMYKAQSIQAVTWYSSWGGDAILNRALQILHHDKSDFKPNKHSIFYYRPSSSPQESIKLAEKLGLSTEGKGSVLKRDLPKEGQLNAISALGGLGGITALAESGTLTKLDIVGPTIFFSIAFIFMSLSYSYKVIKHVFKKKQYK